MYNRIYSFPLVLLSRCWPCCGADAVRMIWLQPYFCSTTGRMEIEMSKKSSSGGKSVETTKQAPQHKRMAAGNLQVGTKMRTGGAVPSQGRKDSCK